MKVLMAVSNFVEGMVTMAFQPPKWWLTPAYQARIARNNQHLDSVVTPHF